MFTYEVKRTTKPKLWKRTPSAPLMYQITSPQAGCHPFYPGRPPPPWQKSLEQQTQKVWWVWSQVPPCCSWDLVGTSCTQVASLAHHGEGPLFLFSSFFIFSIFY